MKIKIQFIVNLIFLIINKNIQVWSYFIDKNNKKNFDELYISSREIKSLTSEIKLEYEVD